MRQPDPEYEHIQRRLELAWRADVADSTLERVIVALPSYSVDPTLLLHYADRLPALEQRYLYSTLLLRNPAAHVAYVSCMPVPEYVVDYYLDHVPGGDHDEMRNRLTLISLDDPSPRPLSDKILERPDVIDRIRRLGCDRPAMIEPWNVTRAERDLAVAVDMPLYGAHPDLWPLASKSNGRRLFRTVDVACPEGEEDVRTIDDVVRALERLRARPGIEGAVVKLNDSGAGDGNAVIDLHGLPPPGDRHARTAIARRLHALPGWYVQSLHAGRGVVEELITGDEFRSPSVQLVIEPTGRVRVLSTHDQVLGGHSGQVYQGCRFPADPAYARDIAIRAERVAAELAREGVVGRLAVDFAAARREGRWDLYALEINLRKGGTTHPMSTARHVTAGTYHEDSGNLIGCDLRPKYYVATDNLVDEAWRDLPPTELIARVRAAGLAFDFQTRTGVVLHMLECLPIDGRFGCTAIGNSPDQAAELYDGVAAALC